MSGSSYTIGGCQVHFPHRAYGVQLSFMSKVIAALEGGHNALLEAPTGSGKTLSLLCSALAWQVREKQRIEDGLAAEQKEIKAELAAAAAESAAAPGCDGGTAAAPTGPAACGLQLCCCGGDAPNPLLPVPSAAATAPTKPAAAATAAAAAAAAAAQAAAGEGGFMADTAELEAAAPQPRRKPPKIFYATRTHSQIAQVVKELKRSQYKPRMAVLGSRKHYCINTHATKAGSVDEACEELLKDSKCAYFRGVHAFASGGAAHRLMDIEELRGEGRAHKACPYYTARKWAEEAEVIFCPYSYLTDPVIRRAMAVDVEGSLLIFDEAHNMEDVCREAASTEVDLHTMIEVFGCLRKAHDLNGRQEVYGPLTAVAEATVRWMEDKQRIAVAAMARQHQRTGGGGRYQEPYEHLFPQGQLLNELAACGLGAKQIDGLWEAYQAAREEEEAMAAGKSGGADGGAGDGGGDKENAEGQQAPPRPALSECAVRVGAMALGIMSRLIQVVRLLHQASDDGARDYRLVVQRYYEREAGLSMGRYNKGGRGGGGGDEDGAFLPGFAFKLCLWCMNPAVAFRPVAEAAHSVVLTSGTLAPLEGFASELGTPFATTLEAPHVVDMRRQVWAGVVGSGPGGTPLIATYKHQNEPAFQDGVGRLLVQAAATIPDGLLVFLPSYGLMDKLLARWKSTGLYQQLEGLKTVVQEPRGGDQEALKHTMREYYAAIQGGGGAVFFAVCRGKVSEGLDFADGNARGVVIVGIPFPAARDLKVNEKKLFNDRGQRALKLVSGDTWYSQQAFRALNQALGRCIRHRLDWGAIMMVDDRFRQPRNQKMLSRWVRGALAVHPSFEAGMGSMARFFAAIEADPPGGAAAAAAAAAATTSAGGDMAAFVAAQVAAVAAAAGLPPVQPGSGATQPQLSVGRGAEGARSQWAPVPAAGRGTIQGLYEVWQSKPLAQARVAAAAAAAAGSPRGPMAELGQWSHQPAAASPQQQQQQQQACVGAVKVEQPASRPQQQQQKQWQPQQRVPQQVQQQRPLLAPAVKAEPVAKQHQQRQPHCSTAPTGAPQQQYQLKQEQHQHQHQYQHQHQHPLKQETPPQQQEQEVPPPAGGYYFRPPSAGQLGGGSQASAVRLQAVLEQQAPLGQWVQQDVSEALQFLHSCGLLQGPLPNGCSSLLGVAVDGVMDAFEAASEHLAEGRAVHHLAAAWRCALPRGLQALMGASPAAFPEGQPWDASARSFGEQHLRGCPPGQLLAALHAAYKGRTAALLQQEGVQVQVQQPHAYHAQQHQHQQQQGPQGQQPPEQRQHGEAGEAADSESASTPRSMHRQQPAAAVTPRMDWAEQKEPQQPFQQRHHHHHQEQQQQQQQQLRYQPSDMPLHAALHAPPQPGGQAGQAGLRFQHPPPQQHRGPQPAAGQQSWGPVQQQGHRPWQATTQQQHQHRHQHQQQQQQQQQQVLEQISTAAPPRPGPRPGGGLPDPRMHPQPHNNNTQHKHNETPGLLVLGQGASHQQPHQQVHPGQVAVPGAKRGPEGDASMAGRKRYLRSSNAEAAARSRAATGAATGFEAAQRAAIAHGIYSSDDDEEDACPT